MIERFNGTLKRALYMSQFEFGKRDLVISVRHGPTTESLRLDDARTVHAPSCARQRRLRVYVHAAKAPARLCQ
jgi:hypothetical protein